MQTWGVLALGRSYRPALTWARRNTSVGKGYDFNDDRDGVWYEGTLHMAAAWTSLGRADRASAIVQYVNGKSTRKGGVWAASVDGLTTGLPDWLYYHRVHIGATAWMVLAEAAVNPLR